MLIVKLSGKALHDKEALNNLFTTLKNNQQEVIIVHGGGVEVDQLLQALDFKSEKLNGIRVSPKEHMPYITATLAGQCNKVLQAQAIGCGLNAIGMLCTDYDLCALDPYDKEYGQVATAIGKESKTVAHLMHYGIVPIVCSVGIDTNGDLFNVNADEVAAALAQMYQAPLVFFSDVKGVLDANGEVIDFIDEKVISTLSAQGVITDGMLVKVENALKVANSSKQSVFIASIFDQQALNNLSKLRQIGTTVCAAS